ncbi:MAG: DUF134 domain-containing protein [Bacteroidales bacterium]|nr:DUF134 domain-containing protein [Bacteroidales bacterium]
MSRQKQLRKIFAPPKFTGFKPYGCAKECKGSVDLYYEEYEAIKMADYDLLKYEEAAFLMGVSRATFARICESARRKLARALVDGKEIKTVYGNAFLEKEWFICRDCNKRFDIQAAIVENNCPECRSSNINSLNAEH